MPNYKQAPKLYHNKSSFNSNNYYNLPQELMDYVFNQLDGKCGNQIKLMTVLLGTLGNGSFGVSEKWICERTGLVQQTYSKARQALVERGWVYVEDGNLYVLPAIIRYGFPFKEGMTDSEKQVVKIDTISKCVNDLKSMYDIKQTQYDIVKQTQFEIVPKTQSEIVYNKIIINNNDINNNRMGYSSLRAEYTIPTVHNPEEEIGEIDKETADRICDKEYITPTLILTATGKYFRIKENTK